MTLTQARVMELLDYDHTTGAFVWKVAKTIKIKPGQRAGSLNSTGYILIEIDKRSYLAHRLAWLYMHGRWPEYEIDHINHVRNDNRIENLREVTSQQNKFNRSGTKGYSWNKHNQNWRAYIQLNRKFKHLGCFDTKEEARSAYLAAKEDLHIIGERR